MENQIKTLFRLALAPGLAILLCARICSAGPLSAAPYKGAFPCGLITSSELQEVSGIAVSRKTPQVLWAINDGNNPAVLYALSPRGFLRHSYKIKGAGNRDWEDLSGFRYQGQDFIVIADVGDNYSRRRFYTLYCVREPVPDASESDVLPLEWKMRFKYENKALDCEAVAVDAAHKKIYLLSKRTAVPVLYELPLDIPCKDQMYTAKAVARITNIPKPTPKDLKQSYGRYRSQPTSMEISADGNTLYILTYKNAYLYSRTPDQAWDEAFSNSPEQILLPNPSWIMVQRESLGLDRESGIIFITTEKIPAPIYVVRPE